MKGVAGDRDSNSTTSSGHLEFRLDGSDAQACVVASHSPSVHVYYALRSQLERSSPTWLQEFVSLGGLDSLLDSLCQMTGRVIGEYIVVYFLLFFFRVTSKNQCSLLIICFGSLMSWSVVGTAMWKANRYNT